MQILRSDINKGLGQSNKTIFSGYAHLVVMSRLIEATGTVEALKKLVMGGVVEEALLV